MFYLNLSDSSIKTQNWFKFGRRSWRDPQDHWYSEPFSTWEERGWIYASNDLDEMIAACKELSTSYVWGTLEDTDKTVFFKDSSFPSLLISRLKETYPDIPWKRTNKEDSADKVITDKETPGFWELFNYGIRVLGKVPDGKGNYNVYMSQNSFGAEWRSVQFKDLTLKEMTDLRNTVAELKKIDPNIEIFYGCMVVSKNALDIDLDLRKNPGKLVATETFIRRIWEYVPPISDSEFDTVRKYLKSGDFKNQNMGLQTLQYTNFKARIPELVPIFQNNLSSANNAAAGMVKYLIKWKQIGNRYDGFRQWYKTSADSDLYTQEEKDNRANTQIKNLMASLISSNKDALKSLKVHVAVKGIDGSIKTIEQYS